MSDDDRTREFVHLLAGCDRQLYGYILSLVGSFSDADDIAQDTKVRLWEQFEKYDPAKDFLAWACSIAHYQVLTFRRKAQREKLHFSMDFVDSVAEEVTQESAVLADRQDALMVCIKKQSDESRSLLKMVYEAGLPMKEVAAKTGRTLDATYQAVWRIRKSLSDCIRNRLTKEDSQ